MTTPKATATQQRLQHYLAQRTQLETKIRRARAQEQARARQARQARLLRYGEMVARAGLDPLDEDVLLGLLLEAAPGLQDPLTRQRWQTTGAHHRATHTHPGDA